MALQVVIRESWYNGMVFLDYNDDMRWLPRRRANLRGDTSCAYKGECESGDQSPI
jgi:hypothetical protein